MNFLIFTALMHLTYAIEQEHGIEHHEGATSYQNIHIEHFHPVPTYIRKEHSHLLKHPIALGTSSSKVEVHHGDKHDYGYAFATAENNVHSHGFTGADETAAVNYQVQDQGPHNLQYESQVGDEGAAYDHYQLGADHQVYGDAEAGHVQYENHESR